MTMTYPPCRNALTSASPDNICACAAVVSNNSNAAGSRMSLLTGEVSSIVGAPRSFVSRDLWVWAQRACPHRGAINNLRRHNLVRSFPLHDPLVESAHHVECAGAVPAPAVPHARHHEQAVPVVDLCLAAHGF